ncbi:MAG: hypothetical protein J0I08_16855 [Rhizobiales bacterium]|nr:hypothetical protein [Hyphomicrobiales bacterium]
MKLTEAQRKLSDLELLDSDFRSDSPERAAQERLAKNLAEAAGWKAVGSTYRHPTRGYYLMREMDGWTDLCGNEGITPAEGK